MYLISAEGYKNANVEFLTVTTTSEIWIDKKDVGSGMGVKNIFDLVLKEIYGILETKNHALEQGNECKMTKREIYKKFTILSKKELNTNEPNYQLANELHKSVIRRLKKRKVYSSFRENICGVDLAVMQSLSKYNKGIKYFICAVDLFSKYAWVVPIKDKKGTSIVNAFKKIISKRKPNKIWVDQGSEFYNNTFKDFLKINKIEMYATYNEGKSVVAERFIRTIKKRFLN